jgi:hypothetical protein
MSTHSRVQRGLGRTVTLLILAGAGAVVASQPAGATPLSMAPRSSWTYTDHRAHDRSFAADAGDVVVGAWVDAAGDKHKSRSYATFDLSALSGMTIMTATLSLQDEKPSDCSVRSLQVWETARPAAPPTWDTAPAHVALLGAFGPSPCPGRAELDLAGSVRAALEAGRTTLSIELRIAEAADPGEGDLVAARPVSSLALSVQYNTPPTVAAGSLVNGGSACRTTGPYQAIPGSSLSAMFIDPDGGDALSAEFAIWPTADPGQRTVVVKSPTFNGIPTTVEVPAGVLTDDNAFAWQVRVSDDIDTSNWSPVCTFRYDHTRPASPPSVTSPNYPENATTVGLSDPVFTFGPNGVGDVAVYQYSFSDLPVGFPPADDAPGFIRAGADGTATVAMPVPSYGPVTLRVRSLDEAGNPSDIREYRFMIGFTGPRVSVGGQAVVGEPVSVTLMPNPSVANVVSYRVWVDASDAFAVPATADGSATTSVTMTTYGAHTVYAQSISANGFVSMLSQDNVLMDNRPTVSSADYPAGMDAGGINIPGTFTFHPGPGGAVSYRYRFDSQQVWTTVPAGGDGTATITYTPTYAGGSTLLFTATDAQGVETSLNRYEFRVAAPAVVELTSDMYNHGGVIGVEGSFTFAVNDTRAAKFVYAFNGGWLSVPIGSDGAATVTFTPEESGLLTLSVYAVNAQDVRISDEETFYIWVWELGISSETYPEGVAGGGVGTEGTFAFSINNPNADRFMYSFDYGDWFSVPVGSDGTATVTFTLEWSGYHELDVYAVAGDSVLTETRGYYFEVAE